MQPFRGEDMEINGEFKRLKEDGAPMDWELSAKDMVTEDGQLCARVTARPDNKRWVRSTISLPVEIGSTYLVKAVFKGKGAAYFGVFNYYFYEDRQQLIQFGGPRAHIEAKDEWQEITYTLKIGGDQPNRKLREIRAIMGADDGADIIFKSILLKKRK